MKVKVLWKISRDKEEEQLKKFKDRSCALGWILKNESHIIAVNGHYTLGEEIKDVAELVKWLGEDK